jgi:hypothetical protein
MLFLCCYFHSHMHSQRHRYGHTSVSKPSVRTSRNGRYEVRWHGGYTEKFVSNLTLTVTTLRADGFVQTIYLCYYAEDKKSTKQESPSVHLSKIMEWKTPYTSHTTDEVPWKFFSTSTWMSTNLLIGISLSTKFSTFEQTVPMAYSIEIESVYTQGTGCWLTGSRKKLRWNGARWVPLRKEAPLEKLSRFSRPCVIARICIPYDIFISALGRQTYHCVALSLRHFDLIYVINSDSILKLNREKSLINTSIYK